MDPSTIQRYHSLDALRAAMMLLGLVLHSAASYTQTPLGWAWPYHDARTSVAFDLLIFFIHLFRMPVFFVVAGLFAAALYYRDGPRGFARNRAMRVLLPLVLFWGVMMPLTAFGFVFSARQAGLPMPWEHIPDQPVLRQPILGHLWFLYYLALFYVASMAIVPIAGRLPWKTRTRINAIVRATAANWWGAIMLGLLTTLTLIPMEAPALETGPAVLPPPRVLVAYGVFFAFGWLLFGARDALQPVAARWKSTLAAGMIVTAAYLALMIAQPRADPAIRHYTGVVLAGLSTWLLIFGVVGMFVRHLETPRPLVRYVSDASYWMYLTHLAPTAWLPGLLAHSTLPAVVKFSTVFGLTTLITLATYHYFVRSTAIGELLNGRRYPRALPRLTPSEAGV